MLDKRPAAPNTSASNSAGTTGKGGGIMLDSNWSAPLPESSGGHTMEIRDMKALMGTYGTPSDDLTTPPGVMICPGVPYLTPKATAERTLGATGLTTSVKVACGGFPGGLLITSHDGNWDGAFNRIYTVTDLANQVVAIEFVAESRPVGRIGPWKPFVTNHVFDYANAKVKAVPGKIMNYVYDAGATVVFDTIQGHQTARLYAPKPLIKLMLYCAQQSGVK